MAVSAPLLVGAVAGTAVLAVIAGSVAGRITQPAPATPAGSPAPLVTDAMPTSSPTSGPLPKKTPVPDPAEAMDPDELSFRRETFQVTKQPHPPATVSLHIPAGWRLTPQASSDEVRFTDPAGKRWIRVESGFAVERPPADSMSILVTNLRTSQPPENALTILSRRSGQLSDRDGDGVRNISTLEYTYIPNQSVRYVFVRWIGFGPAGDAAVEMSVTGLPQDSKALAEVLANASSTVERTD